MLRWILIAAAILIGLFLLVLLVGSLLPRSHSASAAITIPEMRDSVWSAVRNFGAYDDWWPQAVSVERRSDGDREIWLQRDTHDQTLPIEVVDSEPPRWLVTRIADPSLPFGGTWTYQLETTSTGTRLTLTESGEIYNPIFRFLARFVFGYHANIESYLTALARRFGAEASVIRVPDAGA